MFSCMSAKLLGCNFEKCNLKDEGEIDYHEDDEIISPFLINSLELSPFKSLDSRLKGTHNPDIQNKDLHKAISHRLNHCLNEGVNIRKKIFKTPFHLPTVESDESNIISNDLILKDSEIYSNVQDYLSSTIDVKMMDLAKKIIEKDEQHSISRQINQNIEEESIKQNKINLALLKTNELNKAKEIPLKEIDEENKKLKNELYIMKSINDNKSKEYEEEMKNLNIKFDLLKDSLIHSQESLQKSKMDIEKLKFNLKKSKFQFDKLFGIELNTVNSLKHILLKKDSESKELSSNFMKKVRKLKSMISRETIPSSAFITLSNDKSFINRFENSVINI